MPFHAVAIDYFIQLIANLNISTNHFTLCSLSPAFDSKFSYLKLRALKINADNFLGL